MESLTIIAKLFEMYNAKISALESTLKQSDPGMYFIYSEKLEEFKKRNEEHMLQISNAAN